MSGNEGKKERKKIGLFLGLAGMLALGLFLGIGITIVLLEKNHRPSGGITNPKRDFTDQDRLRYRKALERLRYELLAPDGSPPFERVMNEEKIKATVAEDQKKERLLREECGIEITAEMINDELERMKNDYERPELILKIAEALDRDPQAIVEFWVKPILVDRYLQACVSADQDFNAKAKETAEELRRRAIADKNSYAGVESETIDLHSPDLEPEDKEVLTNLKTGSVSPVIETPFDFHVLVVIERRGDIFTVKRIKADKPPLEQWLKNRP